MGVTPLPSSMRCPITGVGTCYNLLSCCPASLWLDFWPKMNVWEGVVCIKNNGHLVHSQCAIKHWIKCTLSSLKAFSQPILLCCYITFASAGDRELFWARWISQLSDDIFVLFRFVLLCNLLGWSPADKTWVTEPSRAGCFRLQLSEIVIWRQGQTAKEIWRE